MVAIHITGVRFQISEKVKAYVQDKLGALGKFHSALQKVHVTIHPSDKHGYRVDVDMHLPHGKDVVAHDQEETVYSAIDVVSDKCAVQLRKIHDRETQPQRGIRA